MYQINPHAAMTDLYGVGKGEAQVFDTGIAERGLEYERRKVEADKLAKQKAAAEAKKKTSDLLNNKIGLVHPSDQPVFSKMQDEYAKNVLDAYKRGGGNLSVEDEANLNQQFNTMNQHALQSKARFETEKKHLDEMDNPNNPFREREKQRAHEGFAQSSFGEKGADYTPKTGATQIYDIEKNVVNPLASQVKSQVESNKIYGKTGIPFEASVAHAESLVNNAQVARELHEKALDLKDEGKFNSFVQNLYGSPTDEYGNKNPAYIPDAKKREEVIKNTTPENVKLDDMSKYLYTNRFVFKGQDFPPSQYGVAGDIAKPAFGFNPNTNELTATAKSAPVKVRDDFGNENIRGLMLSDVKVKLDPETGEVIGGRADVVNEKNYDRTKFYADLNRYKDLVSKEGLDEKGHIGSFKTKDKKYADIAIKSKDGEYTVQYKDFIKKEFPQGVPKHTDSKYGGKVFKSVELTPDQTQELFFELNKEKPQDVYREKTGGRTRLTHLEKIDNEKPSTTSYTISGKSYTHNDLIKAGYSEKQIEDAKKAGKIK